MERIQEKYDEFLRNIDEQKNDLIGGGELINYDEGLNLFNILADSYNTLYYGSDLNMLFFILKATAMGSYVYVKGVDIESFEYKYLSGIEGDRMILLNGPIIEFYKDNRGVKMDTIYIENKENYEENIKYISTIDTVIIFSKEPINAQNLRVIDHDDNLWLTEFDFDYGDIILRSSTQIPRIYHFICIKPLEFSLVHALSIITCHFVNKPIKIYVYVDEEPNTKWWNAIKRYIEVEKIVRPEVFRGVKVEYPQYMADILRLEILMERGGVYLDLDTIVLKDMSQLLENRATVFSNLDDKEPNNLSKIKTISNGFLAFQRNDPFLKEWYYQIHKYVGNREDWGKGGVVLGKDIFMKNMEKYEYIQIKDFNLFCPFDWESSIDAFNIHIKDDNLYSEAYSIHLWQTMLNDELVKHIDEDFFDRYNNWFTRNHKKYLDILIFNK